MAPSSATRAARPRLHLPTALLLLLLLASACGPFSPAPVASPTVTAGDGPAATAATATPKPAGRLASNQLVRIASTEPATLDPGLATDGPAVEVISALFDGLVTVDQDGTVRPRLAERWELSPDGKTYTFTLRNGPRWSTGEPVRARDFEYAIIRNLDPATAADYASSLYPIRNAENFNTKKSSDPTTVGVLARDDRTLTVTLDRPNGYFMRVMASWMALPQPRTTVERFGVKWTEPGNIATNGPFRLESWKRNEELVLVRNSDYWGQQPVVERIVYKLQQPTEQAAAIALDQFEKGEVDLTGDHVLHAEELKKIQSSSSLLAALRTSPMAASYFLVFNSRKAPFDKVDVRRALALALDPAAAANAIATPGVPATSFVPEGILGRKPEAYEARPNLAKARQLLEQAGFPNGAGIPEITYTYNRSDAHRLVAEYVRAVWQKELGLEVKLEPMEWRAFLRWRRDADYDVIRGGWQADLDDPYAWYNQVLDSKQSDAVFAPRWRNEQFDRLVQQAAVEADQGKRRALYERADEILAAEMPVIPLFYELRRELVRPTIDGYSRSRTLGQLDLRELRVIQP